VQGKRRQSADIKGDVCSSTINRFPDTWHSCRAHSKMWFRRPVGSPERHFWVNPSGCCAGRPATRYRAARETLPRVPTAFQGSKYVRRKLKRRKYDVWARYQVGRTLCYCLRTAHARAAAVLGLFLAIHGVNPSSSQRSSPYVLNTRNEETNTAFYSYLSCFVNTFTLNMYVFV